MIGLALVMLVAVAQAPTAGCTAEHAAMGHCTLPAEQPAQQPAQPAADDPHAGHALPEEAAAPPLAPPPPEARQGPAHAADAIFGAEAMARSRAELAREHGGMAHSLVMIERAEAIVRDGRDGFALDAQAWFGGDLDKLWVKGEAEGAWGDQLEHSEVQLLWSHALDPWFDLQAGLRHDLQPGPDRTHAVLGVQGLAPHWWEVDAALFLSTKGELTARAEAEYDLRITQRWIVQPRLEIDVSAQDIAEIGIGAGLAEASAGLRLRYQPTPAFAPYVGVEYVRAFGRTARFRRAEGEGRSSLGLLAGVRLMF